MTEKMKAFLEAVSKNKELIEKVKSITDKAELITFANELGMELTEADFEAPEGELSENELSAVAGGGLCVCSIGGGGTEGGDDGVCACVAYGQGDVVDNPTNEASKEFAGDMRCSCFMVGIGEKAEELGINKQNDAFIR